MSGVDAGGNWAAGGDGARDLRKMAARSHAKLREGGVAVERPLRQLTAARQRLAWLRAARTRGCAAFDGGKVATFQPGRHPLYSI